MSDLSGVEDRAAQPDDDKEKERFVSSFKAPRSPHLETGSSSDVGPVPPAAAEDERKVERLDAAPAPSASSSAGPAAAAGDTYGDQALWRRERARMMSGVLEMHRGGEPLEIILQYLSGNRGLVAIDQALMKRGTVPDAHKDDVPTEFGQPRAPWKERYGADWVAYQEDTHSPAGAQIVHGGRTPMRGNYDRAGRDSYDTFQSMQFDGTGRDESGGFRKYALDSHLGACATRSFLGTDGRAMPFEGFQAVGVIDGEDVPLTASIFPDPRREGADQENLLGVWIHTDAKLIPKILAHVEKLRGRILSARSATDGEAVVAMLGESVWWLSHAMPYDRGSASIIEIYADSLLTAMGLPGTLAKGVDLLAFRMPMKAFIARFRDFIEAPDGAGSSGGAPTSSSSSSS